MRTTHAATSLILVSIAYVAAQMLADVTSLKIVTLFGFSMDAGTLIYPFTFTLRDLVHKVGGARIARLLIFSAAAINLLMAGLFQLVAWMPADLQVGPQTEFMLVLTPVWRIVMASIVAEVIAELIDTRAYQLWVQRMGYRHQWLRVLVSNSVSIPVDSCLFVLLAFAGHLPAGVVLSIFLSNVIVKGGVTLVSMPWIYLVKESEAVPVLKAD